MSATPTRTTFRCAYCEGDRDPESSVRGAYCSSECFEKHQGEKALNTIRNDHRLCGTCARWLKSVDRPTEKWIQEKSSQLQQALNNGAEYHNVNNQITLDATDCSTAHTISIPDPDDPEDYGGLIGFQDRKEDALVVRKARPSEDNPWSSIEYTGTGCICGNSHPEATSEVIRDIELPQSLSNHYLAFEKLKREGKPVPDINREVLFSTFKQSRDFELAFGRARE